MATVVVMMLLRGEALAEAAMSAAVAMGDTSTGALRLRLEPDPALDVDAEGGVDAGAEPADVAVDARAPRFSAGAVLEGVEVVATLATVFLAAFTVFGVTLFFIAILYKTEFTSLWWVNEMGIKTAQLRQTHDPDRSLCSNHIATPQHERCHIDRGGKFALYRKL
jgi:hypothetical protein